MTTESQRMSERPLPLFPSEDERPIPSPASFLRLDAGKDGPIEALTCPVLLCGRAVDGLSLLPPTQESCRRLGGRWWIAQHPRGVPSRKFVTEERATPPPRRTPRTRKPPEGPLPLGSHPPPPPPRVTDATFYPLCRPVPDDMNPATVRSTSETNRRCIRLSIIVQRACDRYNALVAVVGSVRLIKPGTQAKQRCRTLDTLRVVQSAHQELGLVAA